MRTVVYYGTFGDCCPKRKPRPKEKTKQPEEDDDAKLNGSNDEDEEDFWYFMAKMFPQSQHEIREHKKGLAKAELGMYVKDRKRAEREREWTRLQIPCSKSLMGGGGCSGSCDGKEQLGMNTVMKLQWRYNQANEVKLLLRYPIGSLSQIPEEKVKPTKLKSNNSP